jgi:hypothetical protein
MVKARPSRFMTRCICDKLAVFPEKKERALFKHWYLIASVVCFGLGAYVWKMGSKSSPSSLAASQLERSSAAKFGSVIVEVGKEKILREDIEWEYQLLTHGISDTSNMTPIPNLGSKIHAELGPLRRSILENLIERKLLFAMVRRDEGFDSSNAARYSACLTEWQKASQSLPSEVSNGRARERLKARICERSIVEQYLNEIVYIEAVVTETEITEYFKGHLEEFSVPEQIVIRQIVVADESTAKKVSNQTTASNFSDMARQHSITPEGQLGGRLGPFGKHKMPTFFEAAFAMRKGQISTVLKSNYGYHIMIVDERIPHHSQSFDEARPKILKKILNEKKEAAYRDWVELALVAISIKAPSALW